MGPVSTAALLSLAALATTAALQPPIQQVNITRRHWHDRRCFTEGLALGSDGRVYESCGRYGVSTLRRELRTGVVLGQVRRPAAVFGEGVTMLNGTLYSLSYKQMVGTQYDRMLRPLRNFSYSTAQKEGWGLTTDRSNASRPLLVASDGSCFLYWWDPACAPNCTEVKTLRVMNGGMEFYGLNELEWIPPRKGRMAELLANLLIPGYLMIARIDLASGNVTAFLNFSGVQRWTGALSEKQIFNGVAYDQRTDRLLVTGKLWNCSFEAEFS